MKTANYTVFWSQKASRLELFVRLIIWIPFAVIFYVMFVLLGVFTVGLTLLVQFLSILIYGKRNKWISNFLHRYLYSYIFQYLAYYSLLSDERPPFVPGEEMSDTHIGYAYKPHAGRVEIAVRIFYAIVFHIIGAILGAVFVVAVVAQAVIILFLGRKNRTLWDFGHIYSRYVVSYTYYLSLLTDERPAMLPQ